MNTMDNVLLALAGGVLLFLSVSLLVQSLVVSSRERKPGGPAPVSFVS